MSESILVGRQIVFVGAGNMAEALVRGLVDSGSCTPAQLSVSDINCDRLGHFRDRYGITGTDANTDAVSRADIVVLAVKPQLFGAVLAPLRGVIPAEALVISIAAGIPTDRMERVLGAGTRVVRVMPNTPSLVGAGAAAVAPGACALEEDLVTAEVLMGAVGVVERVTESDIDAVTALSGSGPAYVFYLVEALLGAADELALEGRVARRLAIATVEGAARLLRETGEDPGELRRRVTSKGGTTEAALRVLADADVSGTVATALRAARDRSRELSRMDD